MKGRKNRDTGGANEPKEDLDSKPEMRVNAKKIEAEANERKSGGRTAKKGGGKVDGEACAMRADRKPRKSGGSANATSSPFSSARSGTPAPGRKMQMEMD